MWAFSLEKFEPYYNYLKLQQAHHLPLPASNWWRSPFFQPSARLPSPPLTLGLGSMSCYPLDSSIITCHLVRHLSYQTSSTFLHPSGSDFIHQIVRSLVTFHSANIQLILTYHASHRTSSEFLWPSLCSLFFPIYISISCTSNHIYSCVAYAPQPQNFGILLGNPVLLLQTAPA